MSKEQHGGGGIVKAWEATVRKSQAIARKRANSIFTTMSVAHADDADVGGNVPGSIGGGGGEDSGEVCHAERVLSNGDFYTGQWVNNLPHGYGKYLWTDGCMYVGDWSKGKTTGKGRFSWPSGATYEGDFKAGFMDGKGTYIGSSGDTYRGGWAMNLKHGNGMKSYANGDHYDGEWRRGAQEGQGRYQWKNGSEYIGHWRNGIMNGNGSLLWSNRNRYDGFWEDGCPKGNGTFSWHDGSFYVGVWSKDPKEQSGTFYPSASPSDSHNWDPQEVFAVDLSECKICPDEAITTLPSQKMLNWPGIEGELLQKQSICRRPSPGVIEGSHRPRRRSVDGRVSGTDTKPPMWDLSEDVGGNFLNERHSTAGREVDDGLWQSLQMEAFDARKKASQPQQVRIQLVKKQGETISKGHKNYELMLNLQLGIRYCLYAILYIGHLSLILIVLLWF